MIYSWYTLMAKLRINPGAVCRQLLTNLKNHKPLTHEEECRIRFALETSMVPNATDRLLASLSRNTIKKVLENIS